MRQERGGEMRREKMRRDERCCHDSLLQKVAGARLTTLNRSPPGSPPTHLGHDVGTQRHFHAAGLGQGKRGL